MKTGLCLPIINRDVDRSFFLSFINMDKPADCMVYAPRMEIYGFSGDIATCRNDLVEQALMDGCEHIVMMDTDQIYPTDALMRLLSHNQPVVGAMVHRRYPPFAPLMFRGSIGKHQYVDEDEMMSRLLVQVDATGCGCIRCDAEVYQAIEKPWYILEPGEDGKPVGEDIRFCSRIKAAGFPIFVDTSVLIEHMATVSINMDFYKLFKKINGHTAAANKEENDGIQKR